MKLARKPELRFDDGNVVFQAQDTVFRVHKSVLCRGSKTCFLFLNLLEEAYDGCPLINVQDSAEDMAILLLVIFYPE